jgi:hypothetical protein
MYLLYVDFTEAFSRVPHHKLQQVMTDLGIPEDLVFATQRMYQQASTTVNTWAGSTDRIPIKGGTIQGDCLSPILFLIYIEPLLRWLKVGGRGYH